MVFNNHDVIDNHDVLRKIIMMLKFTQSLRPSKDTWHTHTHYDLLAYMLYSRKVKITTQRCWEQNFEMQKSATGAEYQHKNNNKHFRNYIFRICISYKYSTQHFPTGYTIRVYQNLLSFLIT